MQELLLKGRPNLYDNERNHGNLCLVENLNSSSMHNMQTQSRGFLSPCGHLLHFSLLLPKALWSIRDSANHEILPFLELEGPEWFVGCEWVIGCLKESGTRRKVHTVLIPHTSIYRKWLGTEIEMLL